MNATTRIHPKGKSSSREIDSMIKATTDWRGKMLSRLRKSILQADPAVVEEVKWKKPSNPEGVPVWSRDGIVCIANILKGAVRLTFPEGAQIKDPNKLFNTRLDSKTVRAIDYHEGEIVDEVGLKAIVLQAVALNSLEVRER